jgi:tripartite-type tricarboxylate transporter receptor subunit TctC
MMKWAVTVALCAIASATASGAHAQTDPSPGTWPNKPVRIIVDSAPGSATDVAARLMADRLANVWGGQQAVIDNRPGAGGSIAARAASQADPDGYTLYVGAASVFTAVKGAPGVPPNFPVELPRDFAPIGFMTQQPMYIAVAPSLGVSTLPELIALAKQKPGELSYATTGRGRITHLTMELLQSRAGIKLQMIPYSGGPHAAMSDLATGRVQIVVEGYSGVAGAVQSGTIKGIAIASQERLPGHNFLPTVAETLPGFFAGGWNVLLAPVGTPDPIIRKANLDLRKALDDAALRDRLATMGSYLRSMTPEEVTAWSQEQQRIWRPVAEMVAKQMVEGTK